MFAAKIFFLFLGIMFTTINIMRFVRGQNISFSNFSVQAIGITGFVTIQWLL